MSKASLSHDEAIIQLLRDDPAFSEENLTASTEGIGDSSGRKALLMALRQVDDEQDMATASKRTGMQRGARTV